jgi:hypothetical protein
MKRAKCAFGCTEVSYLDHVIFGMGVAMDQNKVQLILDWPVPAMVRAFLGLAGYYRCFIRDYGAISQPLTKLLCKGRFVWSVEAEDAL